MPQWRSLCPWLLEDSRNLVQLSFYLTRFWSGIILGRSVSGTWQCLQQRFGADLTVVASTVMFQCSTNASLQFGILSRDRNSPKYLRISSEQLRGVVLCRKKWWRPWTTLVNQQLIAKWNIDQFEDLCPFLLNMRDFSNDHYYVVSLPGLVPGFHLVGGVRFVSLNRVYEMEKLRPSNILGPRSYRVKDHPDPPQWAQWLAVCFSVDFCLGGESPSLPRSTETTGEKKGRFTCHFVLGHPGYVQKIPGKL